MAPLSFATSTPIRALSLLMLSLVSRVSADSYFLQHGGTCAENGGSIVQTQVECQQATEAVGIAPEGTFDGCGPGEEDGSGLPKCSKIFAGIAPDYAGAWEYDTYPVNTRPSGCGFMQTSTKLRIRWSGLHDNEVCGPSTSYGCICKGNEEQEVQEEQEEQEGCACSAEVESVSAEVESVESRLNELEQWAMAFTAASSASAQSVPEQMMDATGDSATYRFVIGNGAVQIVIAVLCVLNVALLAALICKGKGSKRVKYASVAETDIE